MPAPTVTSGSVRLIGPPGADGSFWARYEFALSDGDTVTIDAPREPLHTDVNARLQDLSAKVNLQLAELPVFIDLWKIRTVILKVGLRSQVETGIAQLSQSVQDRWYCEQQIERPVLDQLAAKLGFSANQVDELVRQTMKL